MTSSLSAGLEFQRCLLMDVKHFIKEIVIDVHRIFLFLHYV